MSVFQLLLVYLCVSPLFPVYLCASPLFSVHLCASPLLPVYLCVFAGCAEWLFIKSRLCGVSSVIHDLDQCSKYMDCTETGLIRDALVLIKPSLCFLEGHMGQLDVFTGSQSHVMLKFYSLLSCRRSVFVLLRAVGPTVLTQLRLPHCDWAAM